MNNRAIVLGASSGIGRELARQLAAQGYALGIAARRTERLQELAAELPRKTVLQTMDASRPEEAVTGLKRLIDDLGGLDLFIYCSGTGYINRELDLSREMSTIEVNVSGFVALTNGAMKHFREQGCGHLVGISSIAALRGGADAPAYGASKAFMSNYLEALRQWCVRERLPVSVTDIRPGFVDTNMAQGERLFWVAAPEKAARQIIDAIKKKRRRAYITRRWRLIAWILKFAPDAVYERM